MFLSVVSLAILNFNPRPPRGGRHGAKCVCLRRSAFQSTPPARGATIPATSDCKRVVISIHAPREGGDRSKTPRAGGGQRISIHAPREGGDDRQNHNDSRKNEFQSTPPARGATLEAYAKAYESHDFNPRPPRGGRLSDILLCNIAHRFQSTPPARGATRLSACLINCLNDFNPRPPRGGRRGLPLRGTYAA